MGDDAESVSWYDPSYKNKQKKGSSANQQGKMTPTSTENEKDSDENIEVTDPSTVNLKANVFTKVANTFTLLFNKDSDRYDRRPNAPIGWTTTGELGLLRAEQDAQYELMEELELKIEELKKEVDQQKLLIKAYETRVSQNEEYLQHCMHWITMAQVFGDVPVAKDRMNWSPGRDAALIGPDEDEDEDGEAVEAVNNAKIFNGAKDSNDAKNCNDTKDAEGDVKEAKDVQENKGVEGVKVFKCIHALNTETAK